MPPKGWRKGKRKNPVVTVERKEDFIERVMVNKYPPLGDVTRPPPAPWHQFTTAEVERIKSCDEAYLVTKNQKVLEDGKRDKQVHRCPWLKDKL